MRRIVWNPTRTLADIAFWMSRAILPKYFYYAPALDRDLNTVVPLSSAVATWNLVIEGGLGPIQFPGTFWDMTTQAADAVLSLPHVTHPLPVDVAALFGEHVACFSSTPEDADGNGGLLLVLRFRVCWEH
jgi:hypothetical protein